MKRYTIIIRDLRKKNNKSQREIAAYLGITQQAYSLYEKDKRPLPVRHFVALCNFYNISPDYLLGFSDEPMPLHE